MIVILFLLIIIAVLSAFLIILKNEMRSIKRQLHKHIAGNERPIDISLIDKDITGLASEINDIIFYQKEKNIEILKREKQLREAISSISHDLRTPLTSIIGYLQLLQKTKLDTEQREFVDTVLSRSEDLRRFINIFYDISAWEGKESIPDLEQLNLDNIIANSILTYTEQFETKGIVPSITSLSEPTFVIADEVMLKRIIDNLVSNVVSYGKNEFHIKITKDKNIDITFQNDISEEYAIDIDRIFDKFYKADLSRNSPSTGLGLYIVKLLVEKINGRVNAQLENKKLSITLSFEN